MRRKAMLFAAVLSISMGMSLGAVAAEGTSSSDASLEDVLGALFQEGGVIDTVLSDEESVQSISSLFEEDGLLSGIVPEDVDVASVLQTLGSQLKDEDSALHQNINEFVGSVTDENGSVDWEKVGGTAEGLLTLFGEGSFEGLEGLEEMELSTEEFSDEDMDAFMAEILLPYQKADEAVFAYIAEKNAELMDAGDVQIFSKRTGHITDVEADEVKFLGEFSQVNYAIDGDQMNMVSAATDTMLLTLEKDEEGNFTVVSEERAEDGEGFAASVKAMCDELGITVDECEGSMNFMNYSDATALGEYLEEHPELATAEYQGEQMTAEELLALSNDYIDSIFDAAFGEDEEEAVTEDVTE